MRNKIIIKCCEGCVYSEGCECGRYNQKGVCPCTQCLVKPICVIDCKDYKKYHQKVFRLVTKLRSKIQTT